jgi:hypothetical protein
MLENTRWIDEISALLGIERGVIFRANANQVTSNILKFSPSDYTEYLGVHQSYLITYRFVPEGRLCQRALYGASIAHEIGRRRKKGKGPGQLALQHRSSWILMPLVLWGGSEAVGADSVGSEKSCAGQSSDEGEEMT